MHKVFCMTVFLFFALVTTDLHAESPMWMKEFRPITMILIDNNFHFYLSGTPIDTRSSCINRFMIRRSDPDYGKKVAIIFSAWKDGREVQLQYDSQSSACNAEVIRIEMR